MKETEEKKKSKWVPFVVQTVVGLIASLAVIFLYSWPEEFIDQVRTVCNAFSIVGLMYLCFGSLLWVSTTGFFDIFGFAAKRALHAFIPGLVKDNAGNYYEYLEERKIKRKSRPLKSTFFAGVFLLIIAILLTIWWCVLYAEI